MIIKINSIQYSKNIKIKWSIKVFILVIVQSEFSGGQWWIFDFYVVMLS